MGIMTLIKILIITSVLLIWLFLTGAIWTNKRENISYTVIKGIATQFCIFEIIALVVIAFSGAYHTLVFLYGLINLLLLVISVCKKKILIKDICKNALGQIKTRMLKRSIWYVPAALLILFQIFVGTYYMHIDDDDAFYVATAATTLETDSIFEFSAYTGYKLEEKPIRYVLSPFPIMTAMLSEIYHMPPAVFAHSCIPLLFITLSYVVYGMLGGLIMGDNTKKKAIFLFILAWLNMFSYYSVYSSSTFLLIRIWQGKALLAAVFIPLLLYYLLQWYLQNQNDDSNIMIMITSLAAALCSSMGIFFAPLMIGAAGILKTMKERNVKILLNAIIYCIPCGVLGIIYLTIKTGVYG